MNAALYGLVGGLICAGAIVFFVLLGLGLCRAAAYVPDVPDGNEEYLG